MVFGRLYVILFLNLEIFFGIFFMLKGIFGYLFFYRFLVIEIFFFFFSVGEEFMIDCLVEYFMISFVVVYG